MLFETIKEHGAIEHDICQKHVRELLRNRHTTVIKKHTKFCSMRAKRHQCWKMKTNKLKHPEKTINFDIRQAG